MADERKRTQRAGTILGDRNETRRSGVITPPLGVRIDPDEFSEDRQPATGVVEGEELRRARAARPTAMRLERLEVKHDDVARDLVALGTTVTTMDGKLDTLVTAAERDAQRRQVMEIAAINDAADAKKHRRKLVGYTAGLVVAIVEIMHKAFG